MPTKLASFPGLTGNQLKLLAMITMTIDHIGFILFPQHIIFRIIGRLSMPIYAFFIAEGCRYTRNRLKYLLTILAVAAVCQVVAYITTSTLYMCILVTFSLSICLIYLVDNFLRKPTVWTVLAGLAGFFAARFICQTLPDLLPGTDFAVDYGYAGVLIPVCTYLGTTKWQKLGWTAVGLLCLCLSSGGIQWYSLASLLLLALYNEKRGKYSMKYLFYVYYPAHTAILYLIARFI